ncbi:hypothetical protein BKA62DRAFT_89660 [Auriculariales sp. MPI-PUGE-AT-0066]|nr:hypothetical protein BKA62DRAFT_89660 [Auriculariales sp. MPI-PUGE-AT-0066]
MEFYSNENQFTNKDPLNESTLKSPTKLARSRDFSSPRSVAKVSLQNASDISPSRPKSLGRSYAPAFRWAVSDVRPLASALSRLNHNQILLVCLFQYFDGRACIRAARVCRSWRKAALSAPCLWRDLQLSSKLVDNGGLACLIGRSADLPLSLRLQISSKTNLACLRQHDHATCKRIRFLSIHAVNRLPSDAPSGKMESKAKLCLDAPMHQLRQLVLFVPDGHGSSYELPIDLLSGDAPELSVLDLRNVTLPRQVSSCAILTNIKFLYYAPGQLASTFGSFREHLAGLLEVSTSLVHLELTIPSQLNNRMQTTRDQHSQPPPVAADRLRSIMLHQFATADYGLQQWLMSTFVYLSSSSSVLVDAATTTFLSKWIFPGPDSLNSVQITSSPMISHLPVRNVAVGFSSTELPYLDIKFLSIMSESRSTVRGKAQAPRTSLRLGEGVFKNSRSLEISEAAIHELRLSGSSDKMELLKIVRDDANGSPPRTHSNQARSQNIVRLEGLRKIFIAGKDLTSNFTNVHSVQFVNSGNEPYNNRD